MSKERRGFRNGATSGYPKFGGRGGLFSLNMYWRQTLYIGSILLIFLYGFKRRKKIGKKCLNFLWRGMEDKYAMVLVIWRALSKPKDLVG